MNELQFAPDILNRLQEREPRYHERAYLFVLAAIEYLQTRLPARRHVTGQELAGACRDLALEQYGLLAATVLGHWNVTSTDDFGRIVFALVDVGLLITQPGDRPQDFADIYRFDEAFSADRVWDRASEC